MTDIYEPQATNIAVNRTKHTIKLDFFIDLKVNFLNLQKMLSLIQILSLMATKNVEISEVPELYYTNVDSDSILFYFESDVEYAENFKKIILDINKVKHNDNLPDGSYLIPIFYKFFQFLKEGSLSQPAYFLITRADVTGLDEHNEFLFSWIRKINAINGKSIEEKPIYENKQDVLSAYNAKKEGLSNSIYSEISLDHVDLSNAVFKDSEFNKTNFMQAKLDFCDFEGSDLSEVNMTGASLANTNLQKTDFTRAQLLEANFSEANLIHSNLSGSFLIGSNLRRANLTNSNLTAAIIARADFSRAILINCNAQNSNLVGVNAVEVDFEDANLTNCDLTTARLNGVKLRKANLTQAKLLETNLSGIVDFEGCNFTRCDWWNVAEISPELHHYLKHVFPCTLPESDRIENYKWRYGKDPSEDVLKRQNKLLGLEIFEVEDEQAEESTDNGIDISNLSADMLTPEMLEKLAMEGLDDPL